jgi:ABC-type methionine transport system ATPase subunit
MTIFVVTHDMTIARRTQRVSVMKDGRIEREDIVGRPFEEDLKVFKQSGLGRALLGARSFADQVKQALASSSLSDVPD